VIQLLGAAAVAVWVWRSAGRAGKHRLGWTIGGLVAYVVPNVPWVVLCRRVIVPAVLPSLIQHGDLGVFVYSALIGLPPIIIGLAFVCLLQRIYLSPPCAIDESRRRGWRPLAFFLCTTFALIVGGAIVAAMPLALSSIEEARINRAALQLEGSIYQALREQHRYCSSDDELEIKARQVQGRTLTAMVVTLPNSGKLTNISAATAELSYDVARRVLVFDMHNCQISTGNVRFAAREYTYEVPFTPFARVVAATTQAAASDAAASASSGSAASAH
jgi:hypothetical protein